MVVVISRLFVLNPSFKTERGDSMLVPFQSFFQNGAIQNKSIIPGMASTVQKRKNTGYPKASIKYPVDAEAKVLGNPERLVNRANCAAV